MSTNTRHKLIFTAIIIVLFAGLGGLFYADENGVRVRTDEVMSYEMDEVPEGIEIPIEVRALIEYRGDYIKRNTRYVDFCDVKETKKEMRKEMKVIWKEMKEGCE